MDHSDRRSAMTRISKRNVNDGSGKVAVITGANAGIGYALAEHLLKLDISLCLACRNADRAEEARKKLKRRHPEAIIDIVLLDTSSVYSVQKAALQIKKSYQHIDYLYLNAGIMKVTGVDWNYFWRSIFSSRAFNMLTTGEGLLRQEDGVTKDNLPSIFQTNLFGHYLLVKYLEDRLGSTSDSSCQSRIIWTSSSKAHRRHFSLDDVQHKIGTDPYGSSKFGMDVLSVGLNSNMNEKNVFSHTVCPGLVITNLTYGILSDWIWTLFLPLLFLLRILIPTMTCSASNGAKALVWLIHQDPVSLDPLAKFQSLCAVSGQAYVGHEKLKIKPEEGEELIKRLDYIEESHFNMNSPRNHMNHSSGTV